MEDIFDLADHLVRVQAAGIKAGKELADAKCERQRIALEAIILAWEENDVLSTRLVAALHAGKEALK